MSRYVVGSLAVVALAVCSLPVAFADFDYPDFSNTLGLNLFIDAVQVGNEIHVTPAVGNQRGACHREDQEDVSAGFGSSPCLPRNLSRSY